MVCTSTIAPDDTVASLTVTDNGICIEFGCAFGERLLKVFAAMCWSNGVGIEMTGDVVDE